MNEPKTILVVDDDHVLLTLFSTALGLKGYKVIEAQNGQDALEKLSCHHVDLVVTDWMMPKMNGLNFVESIRNQMDREGLPVVIVSVTEPPDWMRAANPLGLNHWLKKPFKFNVLMKAVNEALPVD